MAESKEKRLHELLTHFNEGMLVTRTPEGELRGRPMMLAKVENDDTIWFATGLHSEKAEEILHEPHVSVALQNGSQFVSISGKGEITRDREKIEELWTEAWKVWFPKGKTDPELGLLKVKTARGEFWDIQGGNRLKFLFDAAKAYVTGTRPEATEDLHGVVAKKNGGASIAH